MVDPGDSCYAMPLVTGRYKMRTFLMGAALLGALAGTGVQAATYTVRDASAVDAGATIVGPGVVPGHDAFALRDSRDPDFAGAPAAGLALAHDGALDDHDLGFALGSARADSLVRGGMLSPDADLTPKHDLLSATLSLVSHVPEPATWAMMILGFGAVGGAMRGIVRRSNARFEEKIKRLTLGEPEQGADTGALF